MNDSQEYVYAQSQEPLQYEANSPVQSSNSPTTSDTDTTLADGENENLHQNLLDLLSPKLPLQPRLPTDLLARQDLTRQLHLPEVQQAIVIEEEADRRQHNSRIWRRRAAKQPSYYAVFSKSGRK